MFFIISVLVLLFQHAEPLLSDLLQRDSGARALPVQMDMASEAGITICTGQTRGISCRDGANMAITNAFWGRISDKVCPSDDGDPVTDCQASKDTLPLVKKKCEGEKECKLSAKHKELQNDGTSHCAGVNKYLVVNYTCEPESQGVTLCDSVETDLFCRAGWIMDLADVFWGRRASAKTCGGDGEIECDASESASQYLKKKCNGQNTCHVKADADVLDPKTHSSCNGVLKYLMVNYICKPKEKYHPQQGSPESKEEPSKELLEMLGQKAKQVDSPNKVSPATARPIAPFVGGGVGVGAGIAKIKKVAPVAEAYKNTKKDETPVTEGEENHNVINEESLGSHEEHQEEVTAETKTNIPEAKSTTEEGDKVELSEPNTVRSILDRAKEVLKTLDYDGSSDLGEIAKRGGITRNDGKLTGGSAPTFKFVNETAKAVKQVAALAQTLVKHAEAKAMLKTKTQNLLKKGVVSSSENSASSTHPAVAKGQVPSVPTEKKVEKPQQFKRSGFIVDAGPARFGNTP